MSYTEHLKRRVDGLVTRPLRLLVDSRLLGVKFLGSEKLCSDFPLHEGGGWWRL